jgi:DNA-directed RNA polymerase subunit M/transcription elongation factor TFIIS
MSNEKAWKPVVTPDNSFVCRKCKSHDLVYRNKESFCGGYDDIEYKCETCKHYWISEGIDS